MAVLDKSPADHSARLVFADWLDDRDDPRAEGYRAIARHGLVLCDRYTRPDKVEYLPDRGSRVFCAVESPAVSDTLPADEYTIPEDWYKETVAVALELKQPRKEESGGCVLFANRTEAENVVALAFARLPAERRAELLS